LIPDFDNFEIRTVLTDSNSKCTAYVPILETVPEREYYGRSATQIKEMTPVQYDTEQGVAAFIYGKDGIRGFAIDDVTNEEYISDNDYVYYFSVEFSKF
ncbi:MAG: transcriptional regulator, partial [Clostridia bacterium]